MNEQVKQILMNWDPYNTSVEEPVKQICDLFKPDDGHTGTCASCGGVMSKNPHPLAGKPNTLLEVGSQFVCIPCTVKSRHQWAERAMKAEADRDDWKATAEVAQNPKLSRILTKPDEGKIKEARSEAKADAFAEIEGIWVLHSADNKLPWIELDYGEYQKVKGQ